MVKKKIIFFSTIIFKEHARWFIVEKPVHVGYAALNMIKDVLAIPALGAQSQACDGSSEMKYVADLNTPKNPDGNNRDIVPVRDRTILYYDAKASNCSPQPVKKVNIRLILIS